MKRRTPSALVLIPFICVALSPFLLGQTVILGVLEDNPGHYYGDPHYRSVRAVFQKTGNEWTAFDSDCLDQKCLKNVSNGYPSEVTWNITFDGRNLGRVTGRTPKSFGWYSSVGQQGITSSGPIPTVGRQSIEFSGFRETAVYRPLVANSQPHSGDPEHWKPISSAENVNSVLRAAFRKAFPTLCRSSESDETKLEPFPYRDEDLKIDRAYSSNSGWMIARLHIEAIDCSDTERGFDIDDPWFAVAPDNSVTHLGDGMWLVDAGDYDNDGHSELVFSINRYNRGGYVLFFQAFKKHVSFEFGYH